MQGFRELVQLHLANEADRKAAKRQDELRKQIAALEDDVAGAKTRLEMAEADVKRVQAERRHVELEIQKLEDQRTKYRSQLMSAKTNEIYKTLISEIETTGRMISEKETVVLELMEAGEAAAASVAETKRDLARAESIRAAEERKLVADVESLQQERDAARQRAAVLEPQVERALLTQYHRIKDARDGRGMALALGYQCTECHMTVRPQEWVELLDPDLQRAHTCSGCKRMLFRQESTA